MTAGPSREHRFECRSPLVPLGEHPVERVIAASLNLGRGPLVRRHTVEPAVDDVVGDTDEMCQQVVHRPLRRRRDGLFERVRRLVRTSSTIRVRSS